MNKFPHSLAIVLDEGYSEERRNSLVRIRFDRGLPQQRNKNCRPEYEIRARIAICSRENYIAFMDWFNCALKGGNDFFLFYDPLRLEWRRVRFKNRDITFNFEKGIRAGNIVLEAWGETGECITC